MTKMAVTPMDRSHPNTPLIHANLMALSFIEPELWAIEVYIARIGIFDLF